MPIFVFWAKNVQIFKFGPRPPPGFSENYQIGLFTDSDTIMKDTLDIPACIAAINYLLISMLINIKGNI